MKLMIQPGDGVDRLIKGIKKAQKSIEIVIFRFDRSDIERALIDAVERGVLVHALIAFTNRGGEEHLRRLETHFLANGITVARTAGDLVRYHGKMMIIDRKELYLLAFNLTHLDIDHSRSFGLITHNPKLVQEAVKLFEADTKRQDYVAGSTRFVVSPVNARKVLASFIKGAKKELLIVDPKLSDRPMLRLIEERRKSGVEVRLIGCVTGNRLPARNLSRIRLHARMIIRDRKQAFLGSQSLRQLELDARREKKSEAEITLARSQSDHAHHLDHEDSAQQDGPGGNGEGGDDGSRHLRVPAGDEVRGGGQRVEEKVHGLPCS